MTSKRHARCYHERCEGAADTLGEDESHDTLQIWKDVSAIDHRGAFRCGHRPCVRLDCRIGASGRRRLSWWRIPRLPRRRFPSRLRLPSLWTWYRARHRPRSRLSVLRGLLWQRRLPGAAPGLDALWLALPVRERLWLWLLLRQFPSVPNECTAGTGTRP